jgi:signal transduction histidine kinase
MRASSVFKIKVFDLRGITVYSSEHSQIGEDKADNLGWITAAAGQPASEMTHRDRFSAFEGVVENRDLISSYLPVRPQGSEAVSGVFEIYSDVTMFLDRIRAISSDAMALAATNQEIVEQTSLENQRKVGASSFRFLVIIGSLLVLLYLALLWLVRNGQRIIDRQALAQERAAEREERWHREKMAALATMAANVSHEVGNPLAVITMLVQDIQNQKAESGCEKCHPEEILEQARRIAGMTRNITKFAAAHRDRRELIDINQTLKAMLDFLSFDQHFGALGVEFRPDGDLSAHEVVPDHLNEILLNLLQTSADCFDQHAGAPGRMIIETKGSVAGSVIRISCEGHETGTLSTRPDPFQDSRFDVVRRRVAGMGGDVRTSATMVEITLPSRPTHLESA